MREYERRLAEAGAGVSDPHGASPAQARNTSNTGKGRVLRGGDRAISYKAQQAQVSFHPFVVLEVKKASLILLSHDKSCTFFINTVCTITFLINRRC